jgi:histidinol dehydrogenase
MIPTFQIPIFASPSDDAAIEARFARRRAWLDASLLSSVQQIFEQVATDGDRAVLAATEKFDRVRLDSLRVSEAAIESAVRELPPALRGAIDVAEERIARVNRRLVPKDEVVELEPGVRVGELYRALDSVALWIPCRKGPLLSTALMLVTAARVAGVERIVALMPPRSDGSADPGTLAAARLAGAQTCLVGNGVALIAAATHGTATLPRVAGVFGPGPGGIAVAMGMAGMFGLKTVVGIGPTDCAVLADESADPELVAWDLASEAEHGADSASLLVTPSAALARAVAERLALIIESAEPTRGAYLRRVFGAAGRGLLVATPTFNAACALAARFAPEHLSIVCRPDRQARALTTVVAGEVLLGAETPFAAANYALGITAVLPTNGAARSLSGITARDMLRVTTLGELDAAALARLAPTIEQLARYEGLPCHAAAITARTQQF